MSALAAPLRDTVLVEASAGTGKTYTLAHLYLRLVLERALPVSRILVVTFTRAATAELRDRLRARLRQALALLSGTPPPGGERDPALEELVAARGSELDRGTLEDALHGFDEAAVFTIHGFCQRMLVEHAFESRSAFETELVAEEGPLWREVLDDFWLRRLPELPPVVVERFAADEANLAALVRLVVRHPDARLLPAPPEDLPLEELRRASEARAGALKRAAEVWRSQEGAIRSLLTAPPLDGRVYQRASVQTWLAALDGVLRAVEGGGDRQGDLLDDFRKLTTQTLGRYTNHGQTTPRHDFFGVWDKVWATELERRKAIESCALRLRHDLARWARDEMRRRHDLARTTSYDDLLHRLHDALLASGGGLLAERIREHFPAALIDEFQDTDPLQYEIFRRIYRGHSGPLVLIGDPKQSIYAFRGADVFAYLRARMDAGSEARRLGTNYRSDPELVAGVNEVFGRAHRPFLLAGIPFEPMRARAERPRFDDPCGQAPLDLVFFPLRENDARPGRGGRGVPRINQGDAVLAVADSVAADIAELLDRRAQVETESGRRPLRASDIAVLCRRNQDAARVQEALRRRGIASVRQTDETVFETPEAEELERVLRAIAEPGYAGALRAALATRLLGASAEEIHRLQSDEGAWDGHADRFRAWLEVWNERGFVAAFRQVLEACRVPQRLLAEVGGERALTNLLHLGELLQAEALASHRGPIALVDWLALMRTDQEARASLGEDAAQIRLESDARAVQITTIHRSKGLEYGVVYAPFLWVPEKLRGADTRWLRYHGEPPEQPLSIDIGPKDDSDRRRREAKRRSELEALAEGLRLAYVALTRAKHRCTVYWGPFNGIQLSALAYLLHQPPGATAADGAERLAAATQERIRRLDHAALRADLERLAAAAPHAISLRDAPTAGADRPRREEEEPRPLRARVADRPLSAVWRTSSYTALVARGRRIAEAAEEGVDHDETTPAEPPPEPRGGGRPLRLAEFPAGPRAGELVHDVLERLDFQAPDEEIAALVGETNRRRHGLPDEAAAALAGALGDLLRAPLLGDGPPLRLADLPRERTLREMRFTLPAAHGPGPALSAAALAAALGEAGGGIARTYARRLRELPFPALRGYLVGSIDLVFEHEGRWWLVDYKSNQLGAYSGDYAPDRLAEAMARHHYVLQYHVYALALHRHLRSRLPGYDPARHLGGVLYLFLRGLSPVPEDQAGVFRDRLAPELLDRLDHLLGGGAADMAKGSR